MPTLLDMRPSVSFDSAVTSLPHQVRGRGARNNDKGRYEKNGISFFDDGWESPADLPPQNHDF
jgi:hypothetical protein